MQVFFPCLSIDGYTVVEYLYGVLEKVEIRMTVYITCLCSVIVLCKMMMKGREKVKPGASS